MCSACDLVDWLLAEADFTQPVRASPIPAGRSIDAGSSAQRAVDSPLNPEVPPSVLSTSST